MKTQEAILSIMLMFPSRIDEITAKVSPNWFDGENKVAFKHLAAGGADSITLLVTAGISHARIAQLEEIEAGLSGLDSHIANAEKEATARDIHNLGQQLIRSGGNDQALQLIETFQNHIGLEDRSEPVSVKQGMHRLALELERRSQQKGLMGMTYGLNDLDAKTEGMQKGDLVIVAAPSSMGKTAFATGIIEAACGAGHKALIVSCEMTVEQLLMRSLAADSHVPLGRIRAANFQEADWSRMTNSFSRLSQLGLWIDDTAGISLAELSRKVKRYVKREGIELVMVDYLQILGYDKGSELQELDRITTALKCLAKDTGVCIVLLSQLNRLNSRESRKPQMTDLRGSGMIENNADVILFPWRPAANCQKCQDNVNDAEHDTASHRLEAEIIIGKQRQGERNIAIPVLWREEVTRFDNLPPLPQGQ